MAKVKNKDRINLEALDFLLKDILEQIKILECEQKDAAYTKLIELFFKGMDLKEKISGNTAQAAVLPEIHIIKGLDQDLV